MAVPALISRIPSLVLVLLDILGPSAKPSMTAHPILAATAPPALMEQIHSLVLVFLALRVCCVKPISTNALPILAAMAQPVLMVGFLRLSLLLLFSKLVFLLVDTIF
jgi:hypothetical protein